MVYHSMGQKRPAMENALTMLNHISRISEAASRRRFMGHTLLAAVLVAFALCLKQICGLFAVVGYVSHLLLDSAGFVPWSCPFKGYDFPEVGYRGVSHLAGRGRGIAGDGRHYDP